MAQEQSILIQISDDDINWIDLVTLSNGSTIHSNKNVAVGVVKYYRVIAKGDGVNTSDSEPSASINITSGFVQRYQDVVDYANSNSISIPSITQNIINDNIVRNLIKVGILHSNDKTKDELVYLYYFQQENGTPYEFLTLNWVDATKHRLLNSGANDVDFTADQGFHVVGGNNQYMSLQFNPSTDHIRGDKDNVSVGFKTFNMNTVYQSPGRIIGARDGVFQFHFLNNASNSILSRLYDTNRAGTIIDQLTINDHFHFDVSAANTTQNIFKSGNYLKNASAGATGAKGLPNIDIHLFGFNDQGSPFPSEGPVGLSYLFSGKSIKFKDREIYTILNSDYSFLNTITDGELKITLADTDGFPSFLYPRVYKSEPFKPYFTGIVKEYIFTYSTNHAGTGASGTPDDGAIGWGQCDDPDLNGYIDEGIILVNYQSETPSLIINPNDPNGQHVWLFYHPNSSFPGSNGVQQSRLLTTAGGVGLDDATYVDRGAVLGLTTEESNYGEPHTGYTDPYVQDDGSIIVVHITKGWEADTIAGIPNLGISSCPGNNYVFTRIESDADITSFMPYLRQFHKNVTLYFNRNGNQYCICRNALILINELTTNSRIAIYLCDGNYRPTALVGNISGEFSGNNSIDSGYYIEGDTLYVCYIIDNEIFTGRWDLKNLD